MKGLGKGSEGWKKDREKIKRHFINSHLVGGGGLRVGKSSTRVGHTQEQIKKFQRGAQEVRPMEAGSETEREYKQERGNLSGIEG